MVRTLLIMATLLLCVTAVQAQRYLPGQSGVEFSAGFADGFKTKKEDGKSNTADDRFYVEWNVKLDGSGGGEIKRNGYYRLALNIKSMNAIDDIDAILQVSEWETPSSQSGELNENNQN